MPTLTYRRYAQSITDLKRSKMFLEIDKLANAGVGYRTIAKQFGLEPHYAKATIRFRKQNRSVQRRKYFILRRATGEISSKRMMRELMSIPLRCDESAPVTAPSYAAMSTFIWALNRGLLTQDEFDFLEQNVGLTDTKWNCVREPAYEELKFFDGEVVVAPPVYA